MFRRLALWALAGALIMSSGVISADEDTAPAMPTNALMVTEVSKETEDAPLPVTDGELGIQKSEPVDHDFFDDTVFIGDSISLKLYHYVKQQRQKKLMKQL